MVVEDRSDTSSTIFAPESGATTSKVRSFDDFLKFFSQRYGYRCHCPTNIVPVYPVARSPLTERAHQLITTKEFEAINTIRSKRIVIKEMPTAPYSRAGSFVQARPSQSIAAQLLLPDNGLPHDAILLTINDEFIRLPKFCGEPDSGLLWHGEDFPFALLEVGYSDCGRKTRGRSIHWLTRGRGCVRRFYSLPNDIDQSFAQHQYKATNYALQEIEVDSYKWSNQPLHGLMTRNSIHGRTVHMEILV